MLHKAIKVLLGTFLIFGLMNATAVVSARETYSLVPNIQKQLNCLTNNIFYEAESESFKGKLAVAQVTMNRVRSGLFMNDICRTVYQKTKKTCQFSWVCHKSKRQISINSQEYIDSRAAAEKVLFDGYRLTKLNDALYYHATYVDPRWNKRRIIRIGKHIFYE
jgi:spore germination cell wall hydrolase CwlJ-like protein